MVRNCSKCYVLHRNIPFLRKVRTSSGNVKHYPFLLYPYCSLISILQGIVMRPHFLESCQGVEEDVLQNSRHIVADIYDGAVRREFWTTIMCFSFLVRGTLV